MRTVMVYFARYDERLKVVEIESAGIRSRERASGVIHLDKGLKVLDGQSMVHEDHRLMAFSSNSAIRRAISASIDRGYENIVGLTKEIEAQRELFKHLQTQEDPWEKS